MSPQIEAALIAAGVGLLTIASTLIGQWRGRLATSRETEITLEEQRKHLDRTLIEQGKQLTLAMLLRRIAATTAELTDYLQRRIAQHDTAKPIEACPKCVTE
jgi:hypothetical protein